MTAKQKKKVDLMYLMSRWEVTRPTISRYVNLGKKVNGKRVTLKPASPGRMVFWLSDIEEFEQQVGVSSTTAKRLS